mmetsp:Transcript_803/g.2234  ORF Transcript_803/g.2234 Transcript_803/m.2234 type:complete len:541 (+) Transcript_803:90-1712(+)
MMSQQCEVLMVEPSSPCPTADIRFQRSTQICCVARHCERADASYALYRGSPYVQSEESLEHPFDPPLSDDGECGALETAQNIKEFVERHDTTIHVVVSSPYLRCAQTAATICRVLGPSTILMFDESCGEIFGPSVISKEQPERVRRDFAAVVEECKARGVNRIAPALVGTHPQWPESIPEGHHRFAESFLAYVQRGTDKARNFLVVTHGDCVAAAASLLPGAQDIRAVEPGGVLMASRLRPPGPGDAWSIISSERSDDKRHERMALRTLSKAQGWKVDSLNIEFWSSRRSKESMIKRITSSLRKFSARSTLSEERLKNLLKAFSGERRKKGPSSAGSPLPMSSASYGTQGPDPALWVFTLEESDPLHRMPRGKATWSKAAAYAPAFSKLQLPAMPSAGDVKSKPGKTLMSIIKGDKQSVYVDSEQSTDESARTMTHLSLPPQPKEAGSGYLQLPRSPGPRGPGAISDISSSPLWKRRQRKTDDFCSSAGADAEITSAFALPHFLSEQPDLPGALHASDHPERPERLSVRPPTMRAQSMTQ